MKKFKIIFMLGLTIISLSACGKQATEQKHTTTSAYQSLDEVIDVSTEYMHYQVPSASIVEGNIPEDTLWGKNEEIRVLGYDPCINYGEIINYGLKITNKTKKYITDLPVKLSFTDQDGNEISGFSTVMYITLPPEGEGYYTNYVNADYDDSMIRLDHLQYYTEKVPGKRSQSRMDGDDEMYSCSINQDSPKHPASINGVKLSFINDGDKAENNRIPKASSDQDPTGKDYNKNNPHDFIAECITDDRYQDTAYNGDVNINIVDQSIYTNPLIKTDGSKATKIKVVVDIRLTNNLDQPLGVYNAATIIKFGDHIGIVSECEVFNVGGFDSPVTVPAKNSNQEPVTPKKLVTPTTLPEDSPLDLNIEIALTCMSNEPTIK